MVITFRIDVFIIELKHEQEKEIQMFYLIK